MTRSRRAVTGRNVAALVLAGAVPGLLSTCGERPEARRSDAPADSVAVVFTRNESPVRLHRRVTEESPGPDAALRALLRGPTDEERAAGIQSWFSEETRGALESVRVDSAGTAVVNFGDLRPVIPNASSSAGSAMLLEQLNGTVFQFPGIRAVEYRMEGSCELFWEWLQYECHVVSRP